MARVLALIPDLLFGSTVHAALTGAGHEVELVSQLPAEVDADVLVVDLTSDPSARIEATQRVRSPARTLAFYSYVEGDVRRQALEAGFDLVVPRSRMAREGVALVARLSAPS